MSSLCRGDEGSYHLHASTYVFIYTILLTILLYNALFNHAYIKSYNFYLLIWFDIDYRIQPFYPQIIITLLEWNNCLWLYVFYSQTSSCSFRTHQWVSWVPIQALNSLVALDQTFLPLISKLTRIKLDFMWNNFPLSQALSNTIIYYLHVQIPIHLLSLP